MLLEKKWIDTLVLNLRKMPDTLIDTLVTKFRLLKANTAPPL
jgi:hypothetical protein